MYRITRTQEVGVYELVGLKLSLKLVGLNPAMVHGRIRPRTCGYCIIYHCRPLSTAMLPMRGVTLVASLKHLKIHHTTKPVPILRTSACIRCHWPYVCIKKVMGAGTEVLPAQYQGTESGADEFADVSPGD